ncbi:MAG: GTPase-translation elongation factor [Cycloclasticus sp.]|nr:GTPase-translation elongation factor [Cycloclasticus sp.]
MDTQKKFRDRIRPTIIKSQVDLPFEPNITSCLEWADSLPVLNTTSTADMMSVASQALLTTDINPLDKFKISEAVKPCVIKLLSICSEELERASLPLTKKLSEISSKTLTVLTNFSLIYIDIACSTGFMDAGTSGDSKESFDFSEHQRGLVLHRALELLEVIQFLQSLLYKQVSLDFWNRTNALFEFAESLCIHQHDYLTLDEDKSTTIENEFKEIHYFHLAASNRFRQSEIKTIQRILSLQSDNILITPTRDDASTFCVDLSSSSPAIPISDLSVSDNQYRFLNNERLIQFMQSNDIIAPERHGAISLVSKKPILSKGVIHQLLPSWRGVQSRKETRHEQSEEVTVYPGFDSIIRALIIKQNPDYFNKKTLPKINNPLNLDIDNLSLIPIEDHQRSQHLKNDASINKVLKASADNSLSANSIWGKKKSAKLGEKGESISAETNDTSLQGLRFKVSANNKALLKASDLIGIQTKNQTVQLAIIRRINTLQDGDISVGAEMMSPSLKVANIKPHDKEAPPKPVIFLQGIPTINQPDAIISPFLLDNAHEDIVLKTKDNVSTFSIDEIIETNQVFTHYTVSKETNLD